MYACACQMPVIQWLSFVYVLHICFSLILLYINKAVSFLVWIVLHYHFVAFYSWLCGISFAHCLRPYGERKFLISVSYWSHVEIVSLAIIPHLLFYIKNDNKIHCIEIGIGTADTNLPSWCHPDYKTRARKKLKVSIPTSMRSQTTYSRMGARLVSEKFKTTKKCFSVAIIT